MVAIRGFFVQFIELLLVILVALEFNNLEAGTNDVEAVPFTAVLHGQNRGIADAVIEQQIAPV